MSDGCWVRGMRMHSAIAKAVVVPPVRAFKSRKGRLSSWVSRRREVAPPSSCAVSRDSEALIGDENDLAPLVSAQVAVAVGDTPLGRGLVVSADLPNKQSVVSVPTVNALAVTDAPLDGISIFGDRHHKEWQKAHGQLPDLLVDFIEGDERWDVRLTAWLLWVAGHNESPMWKAYCRGLPTLEQASLLLSYSEKEADELQVPSLVAEAMSQREWAECCHTSWLSSKGSELSGLNLAPSLDNSVWAMAMVRSRTFSETVGEEGLTLMVPYADFANHSFDPNCYFTTAGAKFELRSNSPLAAGQEATISYGEGKPNSQLMRDYGFCVPCNPHDRLRLPAEFRVPDASDKGKQRQPALSGLKMHSLVQALGLPSNIDLEKVSGEQLEAGPFRNNPTDRRLRAAFCSLPLDDGSKPKQQQWGGFSWPAQAWTAAGTPPAEVRTDLEASKERQSVELLLQHYAQLQGSCSTSLEGDEQLLLDAAKLGLGNRHQQAIRARLEFKQLLRQATGILTTYQSWLSSGRFAAY